MVIFLIVLGVIIGLIFIIACFLLFIKNYKGHNSFILYLRYKLYKTKYGKIKDDAYYSVKPRYLSSCEQQYLAIFQNILKNKYLIFPQVPLSQIIEKHSHNNYRTELFRVIDFCVFDLNYYPLLCIEINDTSHLNRARIKRDGKVSEILMSARLPLLTLWSYEGIDEQSIRKQFKNYKLI